MARGLELGIGGAGRLQMGGMECRLRRPGDEYICDVVSPFFMGGRKEKKSRKKGEWEARNYWALYWGMRPLHNRKRIL